MEQPGFCSPVLFFLFLSRPLADFATMKLCQLPILFLLSLLTFTAALPVGSGMTKVGTQFQVRDDVEVFAPPQQFEIEKRENILLTQLFRSMNNSAGIAMIRGAVQFPLTQQQIIRFVANLIQEKGLSTILSIADESGLALDIVLLFLTHYEVYPGLTAVVKQYKGTTTSSSFFGNISSGNSNSTSSSGSSTSTSGSSSGSSGGLLGGLLGGIGSLFGFSGSSSSSGSSTSASLSSSPTSSATSAAMSAATASGTGNNALSDVLNLIGASSSVSASSSMASGSVIASSVATGATTSAVATSAATTSAITTSAATSSAVAITSGIATSTTSSSTSPSGPLSFVTGALGSLFGNNKRSEFEEILSNTELINLLRESGFPVDDVLESLGKRDEEVNAADMELIKRDAIDIFYQSIIQLLGSDGNMLDVCESLDKSGLGANVAYNALVDSGFYDFDVNLVKYLVTNQIVTFLSLISALLSSGIVLSILSDIISNSTYTTLAINLLIAIITGRVDIISLILAFF